jgi:hypothetical protein
MVAAVNKVECVSGCGSAGDGNHATLILSIVGLLVALVSVALAWRAMISSNQSADAAAASLKIAEEQHGVFMAERQAKADLELRLGVVGHPDNVVETSATRLRLVWTIGIRNVGNGAATHVNVHCFVPLELTDLKWEIAKEETLTTQRAGPWDLGEFIRDSDGADRPVHFLAKIVDRLGVRGGWRFSNASAEVTVPPVVGDELRVPVLVTAASDDLGKDVPQEKLETEIVIRRTA